MILWCHLRQRSTSFLSHTMYHCWNQCSGAVIGSYNAETWLEHKGRGSCPIFMQIPVYAKAHLYLCMHVDMYVCSDTGQPPGPGGQKDNISTCACHPVVPGTASLSRFSGNSQALSLHRSQTQKPMHEYLNKRH